MGFADQLRAFEEATNAKFDTVLRSIMFEVAKRVIERTPVKTGRTKKNWEITINVLESGWREIFDQTPVGTFTEARAGEIIAALSSAKAGDTIYLSNGVPYVHELEVGSSRQAPEGMVAITVREWQDIVNKVVAEYGLRQDQAGA